MKHLKEIKTKHKLLAFIIIIFATILISRITLAIKDVDLTINNIELHHFYYGIILLILTTITMLFSKKKTFIHLTLIGIATGLILDESLYIANGFGNYQIYSATFYSSIILATIISIISIVIFKTKIKQIKT